jgi:hypothetical protein
MIKMNKVKRRGKVLTWVGVVEGYRPAPGEPPKQRTIKSFGYLEDQEDPKAFMAMVENFNATYKDSAVKIESDQRPTSKMYSEDNRRLNYGYKFLEATYNMLGIDGFINKHVKSSGFRGDYSPAEIFKFLVLARIMNPDSKRASFQLKNGYYGLPTDFTLKEVYKSLDVFAGFEIPIQRHLNERVKEKIGRDGANTFYDMTNYYFEIDFPDGEDDLRKRGVSKEHRVDPIAAMGLFMDTNGLPISMSIFPGNTSESITLQPSMKDIKESYGLGRLVMVADKGLNSSKNINALVNEGDGFVFSQILRGTKGQRYHKELFSPEDWVSNKDGSYRYKMLNEDYIGTDKNGKKQTRTRKVLLYWNKSDADMAARKRIEKLEKADKSVKNNAYSIKKGIDEYTKENIIDNETGELYENIKKLRSVDFEKAQKDAQFDGYFCIITSELDYDESKIRQVYGGLWRVEQSFRILKSDLYARPVFVNKNEHIRSHFLICFVALLIIRILQHRMGKDALSAERISRVLNAANCRIIKGGIVHLDDVGGVIAFKKRLNKHGEWVDTLEHSCEDEIAQDFAAIQRLFDCNFSNVFLKQEVFNRSLKNLSVS